jgi:two-component system, OmpR family, sensor kinase
VSPPFTIEPAGVPDRSRRGRRLIGELARRLIPRTLVGRLVAGVLVLLILLISITSSATYLALRSFLYGRLDQQVSTSAKQNAGALRAHFVGVPGAFPLVYAGQPLWIDLIDSDSRQPAFTIEGSAQHAITRMRLSDDLVQKFIAHPNRTMSVSANGEPLHAQAVAAADGNFVVIGLSTREVERTLHRLVVLEFIIGLTVLALAAVLTSWGVRVGLRPLRRVSRTAQEVTAELGPDGSGLDRRVPVNGAAVEIEQVALAVNTLLYAVETEFGARVRSEQRMRQFLADASHELRTPLTSIRGYAELARLRGQTTDDDPDSTDPDGGVDDSIRRIEVEGTRMSRLVEDLLVLARGDQGVVLRREPVEVDGLLAEAAGAVHSAHPDRDFELVGSGLAVVGDHDQLLRVLINLATNAAIHTPPSGPIRLEAFRAGGPAGALVGLRVVDAGPGLPPEEAAHVFERFWRADKARSRAKGGSGLGMAIVAQIVQAHGGTVRFDSSVERGTTVTVLLPASSPPGPSGYSAPAGYPPGQPYWPAPTAGSPPGAEQPRMPYPAPESGPTEVPEPVRTPAAYPPAPPARQN